MTDVFFDGEYIGRVEDGEKFRENFIKMRREGKINRNLNIGYDEEKDEIWIECSSGRVRRPLIIVENGKPKLTEEHIRKLEEGKIKFEDLERMGVIEYLDALEEENAYVALTPEEVTEEHTHLELDPAIIHGLSASICVYHQHNRGDRVNYGSKMAEQGLGLYLKNFNIRFDTNANVYLYGQKPIVKTDSSDKLIEKHPIGQNVILAIATYDGFNMEDAIIVNKASIERGLSRSYYFRTYVAEARRYWGGQKDQIGIPDKEVLGYRSEEDYRHLSEDGLVNPETYVKGGDVLIGRVSPPKFLGSREEVKIGLAEKRETSVVMRMGEYGYVDKVFLSETADGNKLIKVKVREERIPELGDKFATRHGQKGVIGLILNESDMPFTSEGITPDIILSTHAIPSRMTVSQLIEIIGGKVASLRGREADGTAFHGEKLEDLKKQLEMFGFKYDGKQKMYNGITGEPLEADIFIGPAFYLRLEHMVADKIHARSRGPVTMLTKQPTAGRSREGGLRLGEMEKDCMVAHGAALLLKERFSSDFTKVYICNDCGEIAVRDYRRRRVYCPLCKEDRNIEEVNLPQAFILMLDELKSLIIYPRVKVGEK